MQSPGGFLPPSVSTSVTSVPFTFSGGEDTAAMVQSRPPVDLDTKTPFAEGPAGYTTRPPWLVSQPAPGASMESGACFVQGTDSFSPFEPARFPAPGEATMNPFGGASTPPPAPPVGFTPTAGGSQPPVAAAPAAPIPVAADPATPTSTPPMAAAPTDETAAPAAGAAPVEDDEDAWYNKGSTGSSFRSTTRQRGVFGVVALKLFVLLVKLMPAAMVLWGGYYGYQQFFGEMSEEELAAYYGSSPTAGAVSSGGGAVAGSKTGGTSGAKAGPGAAKTGGGAAAVPADAPKSRVGLMLQQAKDSIAAHDQNVQMANAIADNPNNLDNIQGAMAAMEAEAAAANQPPPEPEAKVKLAFDDGTVAASASGPIVKENPTNFAGPMSSASQSGGGVTATRSVAVDAGDLSKATPTAPFRDWVGKVNVSGVRLGSDPRAFVEGRLVRPGMTVNHRLGISLNAIDDASRLLYFADKSGAVLGKRY